MVYIILKEPEVNIITTDTSGLEQKIKNKEQENLNLKIEIDSLTFSLKDLSKQIDSLSLAKQKIKILYREKYVYIDKATNVQLDSLIRSNW